MPTDRELANALRFLSIDAINKANSGHPGMPMGMADIAEVLWREFLRHNPSNPNWPNRDRFIISNGHGSMLLYSLLHLSGYDLSLEEIKQFRQLHSKTPGHPENRDTVGVETTTGPLGQGLANAVGMALAEKILGAQFNRPGHYLIDHYTYVFAGDGCLMEGISHEVCSLAGHHQLGKLIVFWDNNHITIDGNTANWFTDNTPQRFGSYGWHILADIDGHDRNAVQQAIKEARFVSDKPTLICCRTHIGYGAPTVCDSSKAHGSPLGAEESAGARARLEWNHPPFEIPADIYAAWNARPRGEQAEQHWNRQLSAYQQEHPELAAELLRRLEHKLPEQWEQLVATTLKKFIQEPTAVATRKSSQLCLNEFTATLPELLGGSADLTGSNLTNSTLSKDITPYDASGNYIRYGVREFGMAAMMNGIALYGGFIPYGGTFLVFSDYARSAIRMAGLMQQRVIFVLTHDSIGLGEDGPTHQPIEHLTMLRATPNLTVWRPCDTVETAVAWQQAIENQNGPSAIVLTRQKTGPLAHSPELIAKGGYILQDSEGTPEAILIATGSEVAIAMAAAGDKIRVVSMPSTEIFEQQDESYKEEVLPSTIHARVAIEAASTLGWERYVGLSGKVVGIDSFGLSAPAEKLFAEFKITAQNVRHIVEELIRGEKNDSKNSN